MIEVSALTGVGVDNLAGHLTAWNYYQTTKTPENEKFVAAYKAKFGNNRVTANTAGNAPRRTHRVITVRTDHPPSAPEAPGTVAGAVEGFQHRLYLGGGQGQGYGVLRFVTHMAPPMAMARLKRRQTLSACVGVS